MTFRKLKHDLPRGIEQTLHSSLLQIATPGDHLHHFIDNPRAIAIVHYRGDGHDFSRKDGDAHIERINLGDAGYQLFMMPAQIEEGYTHAPLPGGIPRAVPFYLVNPRSQKVLGFGLVSLVHCVMQLAWYVDDEFSDLLVITDPRQHGTDQEMEAIAESLVQHLRDDKILMEVMPQHLGDTLPRQLLRKTST